MDAPVVLRRGSPAPPEFGGGWLGSGEELVEQGRRAQPPPQVPRSLGPVATGSRAMGRRGAEAATRTRGRPSLDGLRRLRRTQALPRRKGGSEASVVYFLLKHVVSLPARDFTVSAVLSLAHVICPSSRGSTGVVDFLPKHGVSLYAKGCTTSVVLSLAYV